MSWPWNELGLDGPASLEEVRRAYAQRVKEVHPEEDPEGFQRLHTAYQQARQQARRAKRAGQTAAVGPQEPKPRRPVPSEPEQKEENPLDFSALFQQDTQQKEEEPREPEPQEPELDFETLLNQGDQEEPQAQPQEPELDFEALLSQEEKDEEQPKEPELDFDTLLNQEEAREEEREKGPKEPSWDFQRLFHEENSRRHSGDGQDEALNLALELVEMLFEEGRSYQDWARFFTSTAFFQVKWNSRFMAALAGAFQAEPVLDERIRKVVCEAYGFSPGHISQKYWGFYEAVSGQKAQPVQKKGRFYQRHLGLFILIIVLGVFILTPAVIGLGVYLSGLPHRQMASNISQYIGEDFGYPVEVEYAGESLMQFYLPVQHKYFNAWPEGERDLSQGQLGYGTDLGNELLTDALEKFFEEWGYAYTLKLMDAEGGALTTGELPDIYGVSTSIRGETEFLTALWEEMDRLSQENWYVLWQPSFQIQMEAWNMPYFTYHSSDGPFPGEEILSYYQEKVPVEVVTYLVQECDLKELDFGNQAFHLEDLGTVTLYEDTYVLMGGVEEATGQTTRLYLYDGAYLVSVPAEEFDPNMDHVDYMHLLMGGKVSAPGNDLPWPRIGIYRT